MSFSSQTAITKIRAMYGKMFKKEEYKNILNCSNLKEVVDFLKNKSYYKDSFKILDSNEYETNEIENLIKNNAILSYLKIYKLVKENKILDFFIKYFEINEILKVTTLIKENQTERYVVNLPVYLALKCKIDLFKLSKIKNFEELLEILKNSKYKNISSKIQNEKDIDFLEWEYILYKKFFKELLKTIRSETKNVELHELNRLIKTKIDDLNVLYIFREKSIFKTEKEKIREKIFPFKKNLGEEEIEKILNTQEISQLEENLKLIYKKAKNFNIETIEKNLKQLEYELCTHYINISTNITTVFYCFFVLQQIEIYNLIHIIEGIHYNLKKEEIESFLII